MRPIREIAPEEAGFRLESVGGLLEPRRNPVAPEPVGTVVLVPFRAAARQQVEDVQAARDRSRRCERCGGDPCFCSR